MKKIICRMALLLTVAGLVGCGLKGPLYFPANEQPKQPKAMSAADSTLTQSGAESQPATSEANPQSAQ